MSIQLTEKLTERKRLTHEEIAHYAYLLWEQEGRPQGRDLEHWEKAERLLYKASGKRSDVSDRLEKAGEMTEKRTSERSKSTSRRPPKGLTKSVSKAKAIIKKKASGKRSRKSSRSSSSRSRSPSLSSSSRSSKASK